jgi:5S rRNA maturation endonuclease (ribonuclease M5)
LTPGQRKALRERLDKYQAQRWDDVPTEFFAKRALDHSTVARFGLGYTGRLGLGRTLDLRRCLVLPYEDGLGRTRQLRYRPLYPTSGAKYLSEGSAPINLFAVRAIDNPVVHIVEGEIDTMSAWQAGFRATGLPGANNFKDEWKWLFRAPHVERVVLALDPDKAGREAAKYIYGLLASVIDVAIARFPKGMDVNDLLVAGGEDAVKEVLDV